MSGAKPLRVLGVGDATWLVISSVIGAGIFLTPAEVASALPNRGALLAAWLLGAALSYAGAVANAELGAMFPEAGGDYVFLSRAFHPSVGFAVGVMTFAAVFGGSIATLAIGCAKSLVDGLALPASFEVPIASGAILLATLVNATDTKVAARFGALTAALKVFLILLLVTAPFWSTRGPIPSGRLEDAPRALTATGFFAAMPGVLFSYLGWNATTYVASELKDPARTLPRSLLFGLGVCAAVYLAVNVAALEALGTRGLGESHIFAVTLVRAAFPAWAPKIVALAMALCMASCLQANALVGARIPYAMAREGQLPRAIGALGDGVPRVAIAFQGAIGLVLVVTLRSFPRILDHATFAILLATVADVGALVWLRRSQPTTPRPYRAPLFPWLPLVYAGTNLAIATTMLVAHPGECAAAIAELVVAFLIYFALRR